MNFLIRFSTKQLGTRLNEVVERCGGNKEKIKGMMSTMTHTELVALEEWTTNKEIKEVLSEMGGEKYHQIKQLPDEEQKTAFIMNMSAEEHYLVDRYVWEHTKSRQEAFKDLGLKCITEWNKEKAITVGASAGVCAVICAITGTSVGTGLLVTLGSAAVSDVIITSKQNPNQARKAWNL